MMTHTVSLGLPCVVVLAVWPHYPHHPSPPLQAAAHCCSSSQVGSIIILANVIRKTYAGTPCYSSAPGAFPTPTFLLAGVFFHTAT